jgi:hypothetical protein
MADDRPEKRAVRDIWVDEVRRVDQAVGREDLPLYLTLPGEYGFDIQALIDAGVVPLSETLAVANPDELRVVAVESSPVRYVRFRQRFPGLMAIQGDLKSLLQGDGFFSWPGRDKRAPFRARVVNLDFDCALEATVVSGQLAFPILALVRKLAMLHAEPDPVDWSLCLTLHGELNWDDPGEERARRFLTANFERDCTFAEHAMATLGDDVYARIVNDPAQSKMGLLSAGEQQRVLMVIVPKQIAFDAHKFGWSVETVENLRYGGVAKRAPMVTWVLRFRWDERATTEPDAVYRDALATALARRGSITAAGEVRRG